MKKTCLLLLISLCAAPALAAPTLQRTASTNPCEETATSIRTGARLEANAAFWFTLAVCVNHPDEMYECVRGAWGTRFDALRLIDRQYQARLDVCSLLGGGIYDPDLDEDDFSPAITNAYFPLVPGRTLVYVGKTAEGTEHIEVTTLAATVDIDDIPCRQVRDTVTVDGVVIEDTLDWYAQRDDGSVWYIGEIAQNFEDGILDDLDGSWRSGKDGAEPGIQMLTVPTPGAAYRQEFLVDEAEDLALVLSVGETVTVPAGTFTNCIRTEEWTPISPDVIEWKYYAPGVGLVLEVDPVTGDRVELVQILN